MEDRTNSIHIDAPEVAFDRVKNPACFNELMPGATFTEIAMAPDGVGTWHSVIRSAIEHSLWLWVMHVWESMSLDSLSPA